MSNWLNRHGGITSAPTTAAPQRTPTNSFPFQPRPRIKDPNAPDARLTLAQKCIYERQLPGGAYITAHLIRSQSGFYDSPGIHGDSIDNVRFLAINFVFHPLHTATRFKSAAISVALHDDTEQVYTDPKKSLEGIVKPAIPKCKPRFLRFAPHVLYGSISPETLDWNFNLAGSVGTSQAPVSASVSPSGGVKGTYKLYEMMRLQGSARTLRSWHDHEYDITDGEVYWTLEENNLQKSGLPREMTFVMLITKGDVDRVVFDIDVDAVVSSWFGHYPIWFTNTPKYKPFTKDTVDLDEELGQKFEPCVPNRGFNFANLAGTFDDFVSMPGTTFTTNDRPPISGPGSPTSALQDGRSSSSKPKANDPLNINVYLNHGQNNTNHSVNKSSSNPALQQFMQGLQSYNTLAYRSKSPALPAPPASQPTGLVNDEGLDPVPMVQHASTFPRNHARHTAGMKADAMNGAHIAKVTPSPIPENPDSQRASLVSNASSDLRRASTPSQNRPTANPNGALFPLRMPQSRSRSPISQNSSRATKVRLPPSNGLILSKQELIPKKQRSIDISYSDRSTSPQLQTATVVASTNLNDLSVPGTMSNGYQNSRQVSNESRYSQPVSERSNRHSMHLPISSSPLAADSNTQATDQNGRPRRSSLRRSRSKTDLRKSIATNSAVSSEDYALYDQKGRDWKRLSLQSAVSSQSPVSHRNSAAFRNISGTTGSSGPNWESYGGSKADDGYEHEDAYGDSDSVDEYERMGKELQKKDVLNAKGQLREQVQRFHYRGVPSTAQRTYV